MHYSARTNRFYLSSAKPKYEASNTWPEDAIEISKEEHAIYTGNPPAGMKLGPDASGRPSWIKCADPEINLVAERKRRGIDEHRDKAFKMGVSYQFPSGTDLIQIRPEDKSNLLAIAIEARDLKAAGVSNPVIDFRAASNTTYQLTPNQAIDMTDAALAHVKTIYEKSWQLKDAVDAALRVRDRTAIEEITWTT